MYSAVHLARIYYHLLSHLLSTPNPVSSARGYNPLEVTWPLDWGGKTDFLTSRWDQVPFLGGRGHLAPQIMYLDLVIFVSEEVMLTATLCEKLLKYRIRRVSLAAFCFNHFSEMCKNYLNIIGNNTTMEFQYYYGVPILLWSSNLWAILFHINPS